MATEHHAEIVLQLPLWIIAVLELYAQERIINEGGLSSRDWSDETFAEHFARFWWWVVDSEVVKADLGPENNIDPIEAEAVRQEMGLEVYMVMGQKDWFKVQDTQWWVRQLVYLEECRRDIAGGEHAVDRAQEDESSIKVEDVVTEFRKDTPMTNSDETGSSGGSALA